MSADMPAAKRVKTDPGQDQLPVSSSEPYQPQPQLAGTQPAASAAQQAPNSSAAAPVPSTDLDAAAGAAASGNDAGALVSDATVVVTTSASYQPLQEAGAQLVFEKALTTSDANGQGRIVIPKAQAVEHLPSLDPKNGIDVPAVDIMGNSYNFRFRYWINNQSRMYLLENTQDLQNRYGVKVGDVVAFGKTPEGRLVVFGRKGTKADLLRKAPARGPSQAKLGGGGGGNAASAAARAMQAARERQKRRQEGRVLWEPLRDGVFRQVPDAPADAAGSVQFANGSWTVTLNLAGDLYQAYFDSQDSAMDAFYAGGGCPQAKTEPAPAALPAASRPAVPQAALADAAAGMHAISGATPHPGLPAAGHPATQSTAQAAAPPVMHGVPAVQAPPQGGSGQHAHLAYATQAAATSHPA